MRARSQIRSSTKNLAKLLRLSLVPRPLCLREPPLSVLRVIRLPTRYFLESTESRVSETQNLTRLLFRAQEPLPSSYGAASNKRPFMAELDPNTAAGEDSSGQLPPRKRQKCSEATEVEV